MGTPAATRNRTISRSGLGIVVISACNRAQCPASTGRWLGSRGSAGAGSGGGRIGGGAADAPPPRAVPPSGPAAVLIAATPTSGCGRRGLDPVGPWPTGVRADQPRSARHTGRNTRSQRGDIGGSPARRATSDVATVLGCGITTPGRLVLGVSRRALVTPGSGACAADSSRVHRFSKPVWLIKVHADTEEEPPRGSTTGDSSDGQTTAATTP